MRIHNKNQISSRLLLGGLLLLAGGPATGRAEPAECGARVALTDPVANLHDLAIAPGADTAIGESARLSVTPEPNAAQPPLMVWENGQGQFRKASGGSAPVPLGAVRLYLLTTQGENDELRAFYAALSEEFRDAQKPSFLSGKRKRKPRAVDDDVLAYQDGSLPAARRIGDASSQPGQAQAAQVQTCAFGFSGPTSGGNPSR